MVWEIFGKLRFFVGGCVASENWLCSHSLDVVLFPLFEFVARVTRVLVLSRLSGARMGRGIKELVGGHLRNVKRRKHVHAFKREEYRCICFLCR